MNLIDAPQTKDVRTENGMLTHSTSGSKVLDLFFKMGGARGMAEDELRILFANAFGEDALLATKAAFYNRDIRGGQGQRASFRVFFRYLCEQAPSVAINNIPNVPHFGRWDDLLVAVGTPAEEAALDYIIAALQKGDALAAKWMPREGKKGHELANALRKRAGLSWQDYRKLLAGNTDVVETRMCNREWGAINYNHVPSVAMTRYAQAFERNDGGRYREWSASLADPSSENKVNAGALYPHDVVSRLRAHRASDAEMAQLEAQWNALPNWMAEGDLILPICDVSGSMEGLPMDVSIALGLYISERNEGPFKNAFMTFSARPQLHVIASKDLRSRVMEVYSADWGFNTDLHAVFETLLKHAKENDVPQKAMPRKLLILSDMQFDRAFGRPDATAFEMIDAMYRESGYERPQIVFWNLRTSRGVPVKRGVADTALISGFSPSILKSVLGTKDMTPMGTMLDTLNSERYERVRL